MYNMHLCILLLGPITYFVSIEVSPFIIILVEEKNWLCNLPKAHQQIFYQCPQN